MHSPTTTRPPFRILLIASIALVATVSAACGSDDNNNTDKPTTTTTSTTSTTTPAEGPKEWVEVAQDIYDRDFALLKEPDPAKVKDLYAETCNCWKSQVETVNFLATEGEHVEGESAKVLLVKLEQKDQTTGFVDLTVKVQARPQQRVDSEGKVIQDFPASDRPSCVSISVVPDGRDDAYRVHTKLSLSGCPDAT